MSLLSVIVICISLLASSTSIVTAKVIRATATNNKNNNNNDNDHNYHNASATISAKNIKGLHMILEDLLKDFLTTSAVDKPEDLAYFKKIPILWHNHTSQDVRKLVGPYLWPATLNAKWLPSDCISNPYDSPCLPTFYLIGPQKCGTTDIFNRLMMHRHAIQPRIKESQFWTVRLRDIRENETMTIDAWMINNFMKYIRKKFNIGREEETTIKFFTGDASATYIYRNNFQYISTAQLIYAYQPSAKIISILREPIARTYSDYYFFRPDGFTHEQCISMGNQGLSPSYFHVVVLQNIAEFKSCIQEESKGAVDPEMYCALQTRFSGRGMSICSHGRPIVSVYVLWLKEWRRVWPKNSLYVDILENYRVDPTLFMNNLFNFIGVKVPTDMTMKEIIKGRFENVGIAYPAMHNATRYALAEFFSAYNIRLSKLLRDDKYLWSEYTFLSSSSSDNAPKVVMKVEQRTQNRNSKNGHENNNNGYNSRDVKNNSKSRNNIVSQNHDNHNNRTIPAKARVGHVNSTNVDTGKYNNNSNNNINNRTHSATNNTKRILNSNNNNNNNNENNNNKTVRVGNVNSNRSRAQE